MPSPVPTPVAAAIGLVPTVLSGVRRLPGRAVQLPVLAVSSALMTLDRARRDYDDLAQRGERLLARLRGTSFDDLEDRVEDRLQGTPLARPYDAVEDALEDAGEAVERVATKAVGATKTARARVQRGGTSAVGTVSDLTERAAQKAADAGESAAAPAAKAAPAKAAPAAKASEKPAKAAKKAAATAQPKAEPTPKATQPDDTRVDTAATPDVVETVEQVAQSVTAPEVTDHDALPLPDYDHMTLGSLRGRLRSLSVDQLVQLRDYEKAHADRLPVVTMLDNRIAKLATDPAATPSGGDPTAPAPERAPAPAGGSKVEPKTGGPAQNPPSAGDPTNPAQPRSSGSGSTNPA